MIANCQNTNNPCTLCKWGNMVDYGQNTEKCGFAWTNEAKNADGSCECSYLLLHRTVWPGNHLIPESSCRQRQMLPDFTVAYNVKRFFWLAIQMFLSRDNIVPRKTQTAEIDAKVKNKRRWDWLDTEYERETFSESFEKLWIPGKAYCTVCRSEVCYAFRGRFWYFANVNKCL